MSEKQANQSSQLRKIGLEQTDAFLAQLEASKGIQYVHTLVRYVEMKVALKDLPEGKDRDAAINAAATLMALITMLQRISEKDLTRDADTLIELGITELQAQRATGEALAAASVH